MAVAEVHKDEWYKLESTFTDVILCGECALDNINKTLKGEYKDDEAVTLVMLTLIDDANVEPYQCDQCLAQNEAYDEEDGE